ncbi:MAG: hypothetical protein JWM62_623 [Frankiales bacterium]|jgi:hypothetical protein|nr:hypothetical protein [Frankiales bacterium]
MVTSRPVTLTRVCWGVVALVMVVFTAVAVALGGGPAGAAQFRLPDQIAMVLLGALLSCGVLSLTRARVVADAEGVRVRNVVGERLFPWQVIRAVRLDDGASWASLDLQDDDTVALLGIQSNDGERSVEAVLALRRLLAESRKAP